jgi:hypothetical protein
MSKATAKTVWDTLTSSIKDDNLTIAFLREYPIGAEPFGYMNSTDLCNKMVNDWRTFIERASRVEQKKGYFKRCANLLALQIVEQRGPAELLALLLSEFNVDPQLKDTCGRKMLGTALFSHITENAMQIIVAFCKNNANRFGKCSLFATSMIFNIISVKAHLYFDPISGDHVNSTAFLLKIILDTDASLFNHVVHHTTGLRHDIWCLAASNGSLEVMEMILAHFAKHKIPIDMNLTTYIDDQPLLCVTQRGMFTEAGVPCVPCDRKCDCFNCNMPIIKLLVANGANPYMSTTLATQNRWRGAHWVKVDGLSLCPFGRAQLGIAMFKRVLSHRAMVIWAMPDHFPPDVVALICKFIGIGKTSMADPKNPWVPSMPIRTDDVDSMWFGCYVLVDRHRDELKALRV